MVRDLLQLVDLDVLGFRLDQRGDLILELTLTPLSRLLYSWHLS